MNRWDKMSKQDIKNKVIDILKTNVEKFKEIELDENTKINTQKELDSMTFIYLMCKLEEEFHIEIPEKKWVNFKTLGDVIDEIERVI